jgi:hypothetical protein
MCDVLAIDATAASGVLARLAPSWRHRPTLAQHDSHVTWSPAAGGSALPAGLALAPARVAGPVWPAPRRDGIHTGRTAGAPETMTRPAHPMAWRIMVILAEWLVHLTTAYLMVGTAFWVPFAWRGAARVDPHARGATWGFRLIILPGTAILWPILAWRWMSGATSPPEEWNAHRAGSRWTAAEPVRLDRPDAVLLATASRGPETGHEPEETIRDGAHPNVTSVNPAQWGRLDRPHGPGTGGPSRAWPSASRRRDLGVSGCRDLRGRLLGTP